MTLFLLKDLSSIVFTHLLLNHESIEQVEYLLEFCIHLVHLFNTQTKVLEKHKLQYNTIQYNTIQWTYNNNLFVWCLTSRQYK